MTLRENNGFTLVEFLVAMAIASLLLTAVVSAYQLQVTSKNTQDVVTDMNQTVRAALEVMANEIRAARLDTLNTANAGFMIADTNQLRFSMDISDGVTFQPDGDIDDANEQVDYALTGTGNLGRTTAGADGVFDGSEVAQPLARNVDALDFVYLDGANPPNVIATPVTAANMPTIRSIEVTLVARAGEDGGGGFTRRFRDTTNYVNQRGTVILAAPNDSVRRIRTTTTIPCLN